jgi:hypothetical protein
MIWDTFKGDIEIEKQWQALKQRSLSDKSGNTSDENNPTAPTKTPYERRKKRHNEKSERAIDLKDPENGQIINGRIISTDPRRRNTLLCVAKSEKSNLYNRGIYVQNGQDSFYKEAYDHFTSEKANLSANLGTEEILKQFPPDGSDSKFDIEIV